MKRINQFFWFCAGANIKILKQCPTEHSKYFGIGGTILFTALMATFAGGYALYSAFQNAYLSIAFGIFWGLMIFNLDRYIVSSIGKGDGTTAITIDEWKNAAPRLLMAILLGFVISTPLELRLFEKEIGMEIESIKQERREEALKGLGKNYGEISSLDQEIVKLQTEVRNKTNQRDKLSDDLAREIAGTHLTSKSGYGEVALRIDQNLKQVESELVGLRESHNNRISALQERKKDLQKAHDDERAIIDNVAMQYDGLMAKLEAFGRLTDRYVSLKFAKWLITLLFIFIEVAPVLFKMMTEAGPYDDIMDRIKHESKVIEMQRISDINDEINTNIKISTAKNKNRLDAELRANEELLTSIAEAQAEIAKEAVEQWKAAELLKAQLSPSSFITSSTVAAAATQSLSN